MTKEQFLDECRFAKLVETAEGPAMLIGGIVFEVYPGAVILPADAEPLLYTEWLVSALRSSARATGDESLVTSTAN